MISKKSREEAAKAFDVGVPGVVNWIETGTWLSQAYPLTAQQRVVERLAEAIDRCVEEALKQMGEAAEEYRRDLHFVSAVEGVADLVRGWRGLPVEPRRDGEG